MAVEIITKEDLQNFRTQLINDLRHLIVQTSSEQRQWLKSFEVRKLLKISPGTLQTLRINGTLPFTKISSILYYNYEDIQKILEANIVDNSKKDFSSSKTTFKTL